jgi:tetratricopeptide (TPR) repeat protein
MSANPERIQAVFLAAVDQPPCERATLLNRECGNDTEMRRRVEALIRAHDNVDSFLDEPAVPPLASMDELITEHPGTVIGPYKLLEQIGEGGFGVVFMAEQQEPIRRKVVLKVLKPGMDTRQVIARFEAERQALAIMDHPNIAKVLDAGQTSTGRPYFVMDLVKGQPITEYCDQNQLAPQERLELFRHLCLAVQHAHQKGIIHRDLKPSNVLVTLHDGTPLVKIIDFGIAKALGQPLTDKSLFTGFAQMIGTPLYMSPEQAALSNVDVDTRSDIYSLGVLLYELLTGTTPFDKERLKTVGFDELRRIIREEEPPRPSTRISTIGQAATTAAEKRHSDPRKLSRLFRGELDWIVMKALEKDRNRRYESASAFAADVQHYLADEPVLACPPSAWYRFRKFTRRKKTTLAVIACVSLALAGTTGAIGWAVRDKGAREEGIERDRLAREEALDQSVEAILNDTRPLLEQGKWPEALALVERADNLLAAGGRAARPSRLLDLKKELLMARDLEEIYQEPKRDVRPGVSVASGGRPGHIYQERADPFEEEFIAGRRQDERFIEAFREFGIDLESLAPAEAAAQITGTSIRPALVQALDQWAGMRKRARGDDDPFWKKLIEVARQADPDEWRNRFRDALLGRDRPELERLAEAVPVRDVPAATAYLLGLALRDLGALDKAMIVLREAHRHHPDDFWLNDTLGWCSRDYCKPPRYEDALRYYTATVALRPRSWHTHWNLADTLDRQGAHDEALAERIKAVEAEPENTVAWNARGDFYRNERHEYDKALADYSRAIELKPDFAEAWWDRGWAYLDLHQYDKAIADCTKAIELGTYNAMPWNIRAGAYRGLHQYDKAITDYSKAIELRPECPFDWSGRAGAYHCLLQYDKALADLNKAIELDPKDAVSWNNRGSAHFGLREYDKALADVNKAIELDPNYAMAWNNRGSAYNKLRQYDKALADLNKAIELDPNFALAWYNRGHAYFGLRRWDKAMADCNKAIELDPKDALAWNNRGAGYMEHGQYDKALADLNKAIELDPKCVVAWISRGFAYNELGQYEKALAEVNKAIELDPNFAMAWNNRGFAYQELDQYDKALADFNKALELEPKDAVTWNNRGIAYLRLRQYDKALADLNKALELEPTHSMVQRELAWLLATCPEADIRDPDRAVRLAENIVAGAPREASFWATLGAARYRAGDWKGSAQALEEALKLLQGTDGFDAKVGRSLLFLAMAHQQLGHDEEARHAYDRARAWLETNRKIVQGTPWLADELCRFQREAEELLKQRPEKKQEPPAKAPGR